MVIDVITGFDVLALLLAIGLAVTWSGLIPAAGLPQSESAAAWRGTRRLLALCVALLWLTGLAWLWARTAAMSGQPAGAALPLVPKVLLHSHFGAVWWLRLAALLWATLLLLWVFRAGKRWRPVGIAALLFGLAWIAASRSASGHAAADGDWTLREGMDWLHLMSISLWGGSLVATTLLVFPRLGHAAPDARAAFAARFSLLATWALAGVLVSGIYGAWHMLPTVSALWTSHYGRLLAVKILLVADMVAFGALNHYFLVPELQAADAYKIALIRRLRLSVLMEVFLLLGVLATTALLLGSEPPMG